MTKKEFKERWERFFTAERLKGLLYKEPLKDKKTRAERKAETDNKYFSSDKFKTVIKRYRQTEKGKETIKRVNNRYLQTEKGKEAKKETTKRYRATEKGREAVRRADKKYKQTPKGKEAKRRAEKRYWERKKQWKENTAS